MTDALILMLAFVAAVAAAHVAWSLAAELLARWKARP